MGSVVAGVSVVEAVAASAGSVEVAGFVGVEGGRVGDISRMRGGQEWVVEVGRVGEIAPARRADIPLRRDALRSREWR